MINKTCLQQVSKPVKTGPLGSGSHNLLGNSFQKKKEIRVGLSEDFGAKAA